MSNSCPTHFWLLLLPAQTRDTAAPDFSHILFTSSRLVLSSGLSPGRSKLTRRNIVSIQDVNIYSPRPYWILLRLFTEILPKLTSIPNVCISRFSSFKNYLLNSLLGKRNEVAHVQYAAHLQHNPSDPLSSAHTTLCSMILDELLITESALNFFLSIRTLLRKDCAEILHWLKDPSEPVRPPIFLFFPFDRWRPPHFRLHPWSFRVTWTLCVTCMRH